MIRFLRLLSVILLLLLPGCAPRHVMVKEAGGVTLYLDVPKAEEVLFASSANSFQLQSTRKNPAGLWLTNTLADREFHYFYVVDGRVYVPDCRYREKDDFGATNCIYQP
jgi:hypothetical protein